MNIRQLDFPKCARFDERWFRDNFRPSRTQIQAKIDGHRRVLVHTSEGKFHCYGRRESTVTLQKEDCFDRVGGVVRSYAERTPPGTVIDGEVYVPGGTSEAVPTLMADDSKDLKFVAFGVLFCGGSINSGPLDADEVFCQALGIPWVHHFEIGASSFENVHQYVVEATKALKYEGFVLKNQAWGPMAKFKPMETYDVVCTGSVPGNGKYCRQIGALVFSAYDSAGVLREIGKCSGMTDTQRLEFTRRIPIGEVMEVSAQGVAGRGRLRHPQFKRMRPDKNARECRVPTK